MAIARDFEARFRLEKCRRAQSGLSLLPGRQCALEDLHMQARDRLVCPAAPLQTREAADSDCVKDSALDRAEAHGAGAVLGVALQGALELCALAFGTARTPLPRHDMPPCLWCRRATAGWDVVLAIAPRDRMSCQYNRILTGWACCALF